CNNSHIHDPWLVRTVLSSVIHKLDWNRFGSSKTNNKSRHQADYSDCWLVDGYLLALHLEWFRRLWWRRRLLTHLHHRHGAGVFHHAHCHLAGASQRRSSSSRVSTRRSCTTI